MYLLLQTVSRNNLKFVHNRSLFTAYEILHGYAGSHQILIRPNYSGPVFNTSQGILASPYAPP